MQSVKSAITAVAIAAFAGEAFSVELQTTWYESDEVTQCKNDYYW